MSCFCFFLYFWSFIKSESDARKDSSAEKSKNPDSKLSSKDSLSHSADELSERVRKLLKQIDNSLEEKTELAEPSPRVPKLRNLENLGDQEKTQDNIGTAATRLDNE